MHRRSGTVRELFGNITALQARHDVKPIWPDDAGHLLDRDICISAEIRNVAGILLVGLLTTFNEMADRVAMHAVRRDLVERRRRAAPLGRSFTLAMLQRSV